MTRRRRTAYLQGPPEIARDPREQRRHAGTRRTCDEAKSATASKRYARLSDPPRTLLQLLTRVAPTPESAPCRHSLVRWLQPLTQRQGAYPRAPQSTDRSPVSPARTMTIVVGARPALAALSAMPARSCLRPAFVGLRPCRRSLASTARRALPEYRGSLPNRIAIERRPASEVLGAAGVAIEEDDGVSMPAQRSRRALLWPAAFAVGLIGGSFALAAWQTNVDSDRRIRALRESGTRIQLAGWLSRDRAGAAVGIDRALYATRQQEVAAWCKQAYKSFASAPEGLRNVALALLDRWARMDESRRTCERAHSELG